MEKTAPMDRLFCGDVGYGKTEVALRAVMKCVLDGYQAAMLVPDHRPRPAALRHRRQQRFAAIP
jgi:primosomal protein N'